MKTMTILVPTSATFPLAAVSITFIYIESAWESRYRILFMMWLMLIQWQTDLFSITSLENKPYGTLFLFLTFAVAICSQSSSRTLFFAIFVMACTVTIILF